VKNFAYQKCWKSPGLGDTAARQAHAYSILKELRYGPESKDYFFVIDT
jgi:hypothetical protein